INTYYTYSFTIPIYLYLYIFTYILLFISYMSNLCKLSFPFSFTPSTISLLIITIIYSLVNFLIYISIIHLTYYFFSFSLPLL
ncbi:hypothetical protein J3Q64DRAFT_1706535, partial [Phycomyces blakesleeanus]